MANQLELWTSGEVAKLTRMFDGWLHLPRRVRPLPAGT